jgi:hypothetical protein
MNIQQLIFLASTGILLAGCYHSFIDDPPERTISGQVVRGDSSAPVESASITFYSGRQRGFSLLPWDTFGIDAATTTDEKGGFRLVAKLNASVHATVQNDEFVQSFDLPSFPASNRLDGLIWRLTKKRPTVPNLQ